MLILNARREDDNNWNFDLKITHEEVDYLVNTAIGALILAGQVKIKEQDEPQEFSLLAPQAETLN